MVHSFLGTASCHPVHMAGRAQMSDRITATESGDQPRDMVTGRYGRRSRQVEPVAPLLDMLRHDAAMSARSVWNDPRLAVHIDRSVLSWLMTWDGTGTVRSYIALRAANEARKVKAMTPSQQRTHCGRSLDAMRLVART